MGSTIGHGHNKWLLMRELRYAYLIFELLAPYRGPSSAITAFGITSLAHETFNHSVENAIVIIIVLGVSDEILAGLWT